MWQNECFSKVDRLSLLAVMYLGIGLECLLFGAYGLRIGRAGVAAACLWGAWIFMYRFRRLGKPVELEWHNWLAVTGYKMALSVSR